MVDKHIALKEDVAAYAVDALDGEKVAALEAHLRTCKSCSADLADYRRVASGLLSALPPQAPRPALKRNLEKRLARESRGLSTQSRWGFSRLALAGAFVVLAGISIFSAIQVQAIRREQADQGQRTTAQQTVIAMLAYPGTQVVTFDQNGVSGSLLVDKQRNLLAVFAWHLPPAPASKVYQMWLIDSQGNRTNGGYLTAEPDYPFAMKVISSPLPLAGFNALGVTLEPLGGSPAPTGPKVFGAGF